MGLVSELRRRNVLRMVVLYVVAAWLIMQAAEVLVGLVNLPAWIGPAILGLLAVGFPIALIFSWFYELTPEGLSLEKDIGPGESITHVTGRRLDFLVISLLCAAVILFAYDKWWIGPPPEKSIAVLAFENMSGDPEQEYFSDGVSEELLNTLAQVPGLRVISRASSFSFKDKDVDIPTLAKRLNVAHVLEGSVRKMGNQVRITAQLIDVSTDSHLWSETYDRQLGDIFVIQDEISGQIVQALKITLGVGEQDAMAHAQKPTENLEAYDFYLRGRYFWQRRGGDNIRRAIDLFERATELDPTFARAWSSLAAARWTLPGWSDASRDEYTPLALSAAQKALKLDDSLADAYGVLGMVAGLIDRDFVRSRAYFLRAASSEPENANARTWYGGCLVAGGHIREGLAEALIGHQLDPLNPNTNADLAEIYSALGDTDNMLKFGAASWDLGVPRGLRVQVMAYLRRGNFERAIELAKVYDELFAPELATLRPFVEAKLDAAKRPMYLDKVAQLDLVRPIWYSIWKYVGLGDIDNAYRLINLALDSGDQTGFWKVFWRHDMADLRRDPRFAQVVTELGLVDYWRQYGWPDDCQPEGSSLICE